MNKSHWTEPVTIYNNIKNETHSLKKKEVNNTIVNVMSACVPICFRTMTYVKELALHTIEPVYGRCEKIITKLQNRVEGSESKVIQMDYYIDGTDESGLHHLMIQQFFHLVTRLCPDKRKEDTRKLVLAIAKRSYERNLEQGLEILLKEVASVASTMLVATIGNHAVRVRAVPKPSVVAVPDELHSHILSFLTSSVSSKGFANNGRIVFCVYNEQRELVKG